MSAAAASGCGAPDQSAPLTGVDPTRETVITGVVRNSTGTAVGGAYVRLLDATGEFAAEVVSSPEGAFRFYAAPGTWQVRALSRQGTGQVEVPATVGINQVALTVA
ncbi:MAG TPA: DUF1416 domain-containing protein [Natronosporangium sp.]|nr:DUF1416 domain-containing protein [Natronosporangium sp.]